MKKLALVLVCALVAHVGFAQITIDPQVGLNFAKERTVVGDDDATQSDAAVGFSGGVGVNIPLNSNGLYLKPGLYYQKLGGETKDAGVTTTVNLHYLSVPANLGYRYQIGNAGSIFAEAGPYAGYAIDGNTEIEGGADGDVKEDISFGDETDEVNRFDWGFDFGIGYETPWGVYVKGGYNLGLGNLSNVEDVTATNRNWNVGIGYRIQL